MLAIVADPASVPRAPFPKVVAAAALHLLKLRGYFPVATEQAEAHSALLLPRRDDLKYCLYKLYDNSRCTFVCGRWRSSPGTSSFCFRRLDSRSRTDGPSAQPTIERDNGICFRHPSSLNQLIELASSKFSAHHQQCDFRRVSTFTQFKFIDFSIPQDRICGAAMATTPHCTGTPVLPLNLLLSSSAPPINPILNQRARSCSYLHHPPRNRRPFPVPRCWPGRSARCSRTPRLRWPSRPRPRCFPSRPDA